MKLLEYQGKEMLSSKGIPVPEGKLVTSAQEAEAAVAALGGTCVLKAQVPISGRGKAGGIIFADYPKEAADNAEKLIGHPLLGHNVEKILIEQKLDIAKEVFLSLAIDIDSGGAIVFFSADGGINIEQVAAEKPERLLRMEFDTGNIPPSFKLRPYLRKEGFRGKVLEQMVTIMSDLLDLFVKKDLLVAEINPLAVLSNEVVMAVDAKIEIDDNALFRQQIKDGVWDDSNDLERDARKIGVTYVKLNGSIGVISSGAGLGMSTMDQLEAAGYPPANFLETGGGITEDLMYKSVKLVCSHENVEGLIINLYGGINPIEKGALGVVKALSEMNNPPLTVAKALGNKQEECWKILRNGGITVVTSVRTEDAVNQLVNLLRQRWGDK